MTYSCTSAHCFGSLTCTDNPSNKNDPSLLSCSVCSETYYQCQICSNKPIFKQCRRALSRHCSKYHTKADQNDSNTNTITYSEDLLSESMNLIVDHDWTSFPNFDFTTEMFSPVDETCTNDVNDINHPISSILESSSNDVAYSEVENVSDDSIYDVNRSINLEQNDTTCINNTTDESDSNFKEVLHKFESNKTYFGRVESEIYVKEEIERPGLGISYLVKRAFQRQDYSKTSKFLMDTQTIELHAQLCKFSKSLTLSQKKYLCFIIDKIQCCVPAVSKLSLPSDYNTMKQRYLYDQYSISKNLPYPKIYKSGEFAYVLLSDVIAHVFFIWIVHKKTVDPSASFESIRNKGSANMIHQMLEMKSKLSYEEFCKTIFVDFKLWSDAYEPNATRQNRGSVWIMTGTLSIGDFTITFPLIIGPSKVQTWIVQKIVYSDIEEWTNKLNKVYCWVDKTFQSICLIKNHFSMDGPERRSMSSLQLGSGNSSVRYRHAFDAKQRQHQLISCKKCFKRNIHISLFGNIDNQIESVCHTCYNWDYYHENASYKTPVSAKKKNKSSIESYICPSHTELEYDIIYSEKDSSSYKDETGIYKHKSVEVTKELLKKVVVDACWDVIVLGTTKMQLTGFLTRFCINEETINLFYKQCQIMKIGIDEDTYSWDQCMKSIEFPPLWNSCWNLNECPDVPMHTMFLGIFKAVLDLMDRYFKECKWGAAFGKILLGKLKAIKALNLDWCRVEEYNANGNYGTYISETYLGLSRLCNWFFFHIFSIPNLKHGKKYEFKVTKKNKHLEQRKNDELEHWLSSRLIKNVRGKKNQYSLRRLMKSTVTQIFSNK